MESLYTFLIHPKNPQLEKGDENHPFQVPDFSDGSKKYMKTPLKENVKNTNDKDFRSPKRKAVQPKRRPKDQSYERLLFTAPIKADMNKSETAGISEDFAKLVENLFTTSNLHEKLAENINRVAISRSDSFLIWLKFCLNKFKLIHDIY